MKIFSRWKRLQKIIIIIIKNNCELIYKRFWLILQSFLRISFHSRLYTIKQKKIQTIQFLIKELKGWRTTLSPNRFRFFINIKSSIIRLCFIPHLLLSWTPNTVNYRWSGQNNKRNPKDESPLFQCSLMNDSQYLLHESEMKIKFYITFGVSTPAE